VELNKASIPVVYHFDFKCASSYLLSNSMLVDFSKIVKFPHLSVFLFSIPYFTHPINYITFTHTSCKSKQQLLNVLWSYTKMNQLMCVELMACFLFFSFLWLIGVGWCVCPSIFVTLCF